MPPAEPPRPLSLYPPSLPLPSRYLELAELEILSRALNLSTPTLRLSTRIEAFSCKSVSADRKLFKALESSLTQDISHSTSVSPPEEHHALLESAFGPLNLRTSRKILFMLISLLNVAYPDFSFSSCKPEEFSSVENGPATVLQSLSSALAGSFSSWPGSVAFASPLVGPGHPSRSGAITLDQQHPFLTQLLDPIIDLENCEVFSYTPDADSDPNAVDADDESDSEEETNDFERDDEVGWEMDGLGTSSGRSGRGIPSYLGGGKNLGGYGTPVKSSFSAFTPPRPGTPTGSETEWPAEPEKAPGSLLFSSHYFLYNKKMKRILYLRYDLFVKPFWTASRRQG